MLTWMGKTEEGQVVGKVWVLVSDMLNLRCLFDTQVELLRRQLDTHIWASEKKQAYICEFSA